MKKSSIQPVNLVQLYKVQILPTVTHTAPAWYPFTTSEQQEDIEKIQKLALHIIFLKLERYYEQLAAADIPTLCYVLKSMPTR